MLAWLTGVDHWLFHQINAVWTWWFFDWLFPWLTDLHKVKWLVYGAAPVALAWWIHSKRKDAVRAIVACALAVALADSVNHRIIKPLFKRSRPIAAGVVVMQRSPIHYGYSFPSNHAANMGAAATVLRALAPGLAWPSLALAVLVCYSRVYVGVHFPFDVLAGALVGYAAGWAVLWVFRYLKLSKK